MSKYGTFPASPSSTPPPDGSSAAPDSNSCADDKKAPGASTSSPASARRRWRELADPSALSVPRGLAEARLRVRANLARFAANYELAVVVVVSVSMLTWHPITFPIVITYLATSPGKVSRVLLMFSLLLAVLSEPTARVLASLPVGILLVVVHAVLHRPADSVEGGCDDEEEAGRCGTPTPSTN